MKFVHNLIVTLSLVFRVQHYYCSPPEWVSYCSCPYYHPQTLFCRADVVVKIKILKTVDLHQLSGYDPWDYELYKRINGTTVYVRDVFEAKILKVYKRKKEFNKKKVNLLVFPVENLSYGCPPTDFNFVGAEGDVFVIGGVEKSEGIVLEGCQDFHEKFTKLTKAQRKLLRKRKYWSANACQCNVCYEGDFFESYSYDKYFSTKSCTQSTERCIYNLNEERNETRSNIEGISGFEFGGCFQGNAYCQYNAKKNKCQWKFHRLGKKAEECEDILNKE